MRTFYLFKIKKIYFELTKNNPYNLYKAIENGLDITKLGTIYADDFFKEQAEKKSESKKLQK